MEGNSISLHGGLPKAADTAHPRAAPRSGPDRSTLCQPLGARCVSFLHMSFGLRESAVNKPKGTQSRRSLAFTTFFERELASATGLQHHTRISCFVWGSDLSGTVTFKHMSILFSCGTDFGAYFCSRKAVNGFKIAAVFLLPSSFFHNCEQAETYECILLELS